MAAFALPMIFVILQIQFFRREVDPTDELCLAYSPIWCSHFLYYYTMHYILWFFNFVSGEGKTCCFGGPGGGGGGGGGKLLYQSLNPHSTRKKQSG